MLDLSFGGRHVTLTCYNAHCFGTKTPVLTIRIAHHLAHTTLFKQHCISSSSKHSDSLQVTHVYSSVTVLNCQYVYTANMSNTPSKPSRMESRNSCSVCLPALET